MTFQELVGSRVKAAREREGWSQAELARRLGTDEQDVREIEGGRRPVEDAAFTRLLEETGRDDPFFTDPLVLDGREHFSWRVEAGTPEEAVDRLEDKARLWAGLTLWLYGWGGRLDEVREGPALALEQDISGSEEARAMAGQLGYQLGLGPFPAESLASAVESVLGTPVLFIDTDPDGDNPNAAGILSGHCHTQGMDIIFINRRRPTSERLFCLAGELFHILTRHQRQPDSRRTTLPPGQEDRAGSQEDPEALAAHFATALLRTDGSLASPTQGDQPPPKPFCENLITLLHKAEEEGRISARRAARALGMTGDTRRLAELFLEYGLDSPHPYY